MGLIYLTAFWFWESYAPIPLFLSVLSLLIMGTGKDWKWQHATWQHSKSIKSQWFRVHLFHFEKKKSLSSTTRSFLFVFRVLMQKKDVYFASFRIEAWWHGTERCFASFYTLQYFFSTGFAYKKKFHSVLILWDLKLRVFFILNPVCCKK